MMHGTRSGYVDHDCRCLDCADADRRYHKARYERNRPRPNTDPSARLASQTWRDHAACAGMDPTVFYGPEIVGRGNSPAGRRWAEDIALRVCQSCDVTSECLAQALDHDEEHGVWGATTPQDRDALRRLRRRRGEVAS